MIRIKGYLTTVASKRLVSLTAMLLLFTPAQADLRDFTLPDLDGQSRSLSDYRGRWVLVNYWATWCPPCLEELPELEVLHSTSAGKAVVLGVNMGSIAHAELRAFVEDQFLSFPILVAEIPAPEGEILRVGETVILQLE